MSDNSSDTHTNTVVLMSYIVQRGEKNNLYSCVDRSVSSDRVIFSIYGRFTIRCIRELYSRYRGRDMLVVYTDKMRALMRGQHH